MSKISVIAKLTAAEGKEAELQDALDALISAADEEPGLEVYSCHTTDAEPGVFYFFELYSDADAGRAHGQGDRMKSAMAAVGSLLAGRPEITRMTPIAAKGFDV
jgi:quinol monooxygenase YgiN